VSSLHRLASGRSGLIATAAAGVAVALWASFTDPFTLGADIVTALPLCVAVPVLAYRLRADRGGATALPPASTARGALLWPGLMATIVAWELYCYVSAPRSSYPTLSALLDMLDDSHGGKFVAFFLWLALGWYLVSR
jgi:hypothetical protein